MNTGIRRIISITLGIVLAIQATDGLAFIAMGCFSRPKSFRNYSYEALSLEPASGRFQPLLSLQHSPRIRNLQTDGRQWRTISEKSWYEMLPTIGWTAIGLTLGMQGLDGVLHLEGSINHIPHILFFAPAMGCFFIIQTGLEMRRLLRVGMSYRRRHDNSVPQRLGGFTSIMRGKKALFSASGRLLRIHWAIAVLLDIKKIHPLVWLQTRLSLEVHGFLAHEAWHSIGIQGEKPVGLLAHYLPAFVGALLGMELAVLLTRGVVLIVVSGWVGMHVVTAVWGHMIYRLASMRGLRLALFLWKINRLEEGHLVSMDHFEDIRARFENDPGLQVYLRAHAREKTADRVLRWIKRFDEGHNYFKIFNGHFNHVGIINQLEYTSVVLFDLQTHQWVIEFWQSPPRIGHFLHPFAFKRKPTRVGVARWYYNTTEAQGALTLKDLYLKPELTQEGLRGKMFKTMFDQFSTSLEVRIPADLELLETLYSSLQDRTTENVNKSPWLFRHRIRIYSVLLKSDSERKEEQMREIVREYANNLSRVLLSEDNDAWWTQASVEGSRLFGHLKAAGVKDIALRVSPGEIWLEGRTHKPQARKRLVSPPSVLSAHAAPWLRDWWDDRPWESLNFIGGLESYGTLDDYHDNETRVREIEADFFGALEQHWGMRPPRSLRIDVSKYLRLNLLSAQELRAYVSATASMRVDTAMPDRVFLAPLYRILSRHETPSTPFWKDQLRLDLGFSEEEIDSLARREVQWSDILLLSNDDPNLLFCWVGFALISPASAAHKILGTLYLRDEIKFLSSKSVMRKAVRHKQWPYWALRLAARLEPLMAIGRLLGLRLWAGLRPMATMRKWEFLRQQAMARRDRFFRTPMPGIQNRQRQWNLTMSQVVKLIRDSHALSVEEDRILRVVQAIVLHWIQTGTLNIGVRPPNSGRLLLGKPSKTNIAA